MHLGAGAVFGKCAGSGRSHGEPLPFGEQGFVGWLLLKQLPVLAEPLVPVVPEVAVPASHTGGGGGVDPSTHVLKVCGAPTLVGWRKNPKIGRAHV